jgi:hypothetical protein
LDEVPEPGGRIPSDVVRSRSLSDGGFWGVCAREFIPTGVVPLYMEPPVTGCCAKPVKLLDTGGS